MKKIFIFFLTLGLLSWVFATIATAFEFDRRRDQFENTPGYLILPAPYEFPGIGSGMMLIGYAGNLFETPVDAQILAFNGDAEGVLAGLDEIFIIPSFFYLTGQLVEVYKFGINSYSSRGMDTEKEDFNILVGSKYLQNTLTATMTLFDRRLELSLASQTSEGNTIEIRDHEGELITEFEDPVEFEGRLTRTQLLIDLTDDFNDPLSGLRFRGTRVFNYAQEDDNPEYNVYTYGMTYFFPIFEKSTWAFHYERSDAQVLNKGQEDLQTLLDDAGYGDCVNADDQTACEEAIEDDVGNTLNGNKHGTANSLGGTARLRSYPDSRYQAAHSMFYGTEARLNFNTGASNLDLYFISDVMEALQLVVFFEQGSVSEKSGELGEITRNSYGGGIRLVAGSGNVYRFEVASGDEGAETILFFQYPWD